MYFFKLTKQAVDREIEESTSGEGQALLHVDVTQFRTNHGACKSTHGGEKLETQDLVETVIQLEQQCKITDFMRDLMEEHGDSGGQAELVVCLICNTDAESICKIMNKISDH